jgi:ribonuclease J
LLWLKKKFEKKVIIEGKSMKDNVEIARNLKYIKAKKGTILKPNQMQKFPDSKIAFCCTGAQGEEGATLMKIANREYKFLRLKKGDTIIFSSSVIPGNERTVQILKDEFYRQGARVYHYQMMDIHASGHAHQEELKEMIRIMRPRFFLPIHGQYSMLVRHAELAEREGIPKENIVIAENGQIINLSQKRVFIEKEKAPSNYVMVDGLGIGDVGEVVLRDRQTLAKDGMFVIVVVVDRQAGKVKGSPDIISRGFVYLRESKELLKDTRKRVIGIVNRAAGSGGAVNWTYVKDDEIRNKIGEFLFQRTKRRPMVLPVVIEV